MIDSTEFRQASKAGRPVRPVLVLGALVVLLAVVVFFFEQHRKSSVAVVPVSAALAPEAVDTAVVSPAVAPVAVPKIIKPATPPAVAVAKARPADVPIEKLSPAQLVDALTQIGLDGAVTPEQAARFKRILDELVQRGAVSVPAIQEFLARNLDLGYGNIAGGALLGYSSLRAGLLDALTQIGGPEAQSAMLAILQTTAAPGELLKLSGGLNQQAPGQYRDQILSAAQETLQMASSNQLGTNTELGPAYRILQSYGTVNSTDEVAKNDPAQFVNAVQLANLPDGQGLSSLIQMQQTSSGGGQLVATEMIAQMANDNPDALTALAQMAADGKIRAGDWVQIAPILGGQQFQIDPSGQNYQVVSPTLTSDQISQRILLIDTLASFVPDGSGASKALAQERTALSGKLGSN